MIYLIGLGPGSAEALPPRAFSLLTSGLPVLLRTERHPVLHTDPLRSALARCPVTALDEEYEHGSSFTDTYHAIVGRVLRAQAVHGEIVYAVPGHPLVGETTVAWLLEKTRSSGIPTTILGAPSFVDACLEAVGAAVTGNLHVVDALLLDPEAAASPASLRAEGPVLLYQVHSRSAASNAKLALLRAGYPDEFPVTVVHAAGLPQQERKATIPLYALDRKENQPLIDHLTTVWVPELPSDQRTADFDSLLGIVARLRDPEGGCPWDLKQTHTSLRRYAIEEAYEVAEAIDQADPDALCEELGDLLLQVVLHGQIARESGDFDAQEICAGLCAKLIRRHPHVFGEAQADTPAEVLQQWNEIKAQEKKDRRPQNAEPSVLEGIVQSLPALSLALETSKRVVTVGFEWPEAKQVFEKLVEELDELRVELEAGDQARFSEELGDVLFTLVNLGRKFGVDAEEALRTQVSRFSGRWRFMESAARTRGQRLAELSLDQQEALWQEAKRAEKTRERVG